MNLPNSELETSQHSVGTKNQHEVELLKDFIEAVKSEYSRQDSTPTTTKWSQIQPLTNKLKALQNTNINEIQQFGFIKYLLQYVEIALNVVSSYEGSDYKKQKQYACVLLNFIPDFFKSPDNKNIFVRQGTVSVFDLFMYGAFTMTAKKELLRMFNTIATESKKQVRIEAARSIIYYMYKLLDSLSTFGDYEIQSDVMETLFRIFGSEITKSSAQYELLLPGSDDLGKALATDISINNFDTDVRRWLNKFNSNSQLIFSIACKALMFGNITCKPPGDYNGVTWVDFDLKDNVISFFLEDFSNNQWNRILIITKDVRKVEVKRQFASKENTTTILMYLSKPCTSELPVSQDYWNSLDKCFKMIIGNEEKEKITRLISQILPRLFGDIFLHTSARISDKIKHVYKPLAIKISKRKSTISDLSSATTKSMGDSSAASVLHPPMHRAIMSLASPVSETKSDESTVPNIKISLGGRQAPRRGDISPVVTDFSRFTSHCEVTSDRVSVILSNDSEIFTNRSQSSDLLDDARTLHKQGRNKVQDNIVTSSHKADDVSSRIEILSGQCYGSPPIPIQAGIAFHSPEVFSSSPVKHSRLVTQDFSDDAFHSAGSENMEYAKDDINKQALEGKVSLYKVSEEIIEDNFETAKENLNNIVESELLGAVKDYKKDEQKYKKIERKVIECANLNIVRTSKNDITSRVETYHEVIADSEIICNRNLAITEVINENYNEVERKVSSDDQTRDENFRHSQAELITPPAAFRFLNGKQVEDTTADILTPDLFDMPTQKNEMNVIRNEENYSSENNCETIIFSPPTQENKNSDYKTQSTADNFTELSLAVNVGISETQHSDEVSKTTSKRKTAPAVSIVTRNEENKENIIDLTLDDDITSAYSQERDNKTINVQSKAMLNIPELFKILTVDAPQVITSKDAGVVKDNPIKKDVKKIKSRRLIKTGKKQFRLDGDSELPISDQLKGKVVEEGTAEENLASDAEHHVPSGRLGNSSSQYVTNEKGVAEEPNVVSDGKDHNMQLSDFRKKSIQTVATQAGDIEVHLVHLMNEACSGLDAKIGAAKDSDVSSAYDDIAIENGIADDVNSTSVGEECIQKKSSQDVSSKIGAAEDSNAPLLYDGFAIERGITDDVNVTADAVECIQSAHLEKKSSQGVASKIGAAEDSNAPSSYDGIAIERGITDDVNVIADAVECTQSAHWEKISSQDVASKIGIAGDLNVSVAEGYIQSARWEKKPSEDFASKIGIAEAQSVPFENKSCQGLAAETGVREDLAVPSIVDDHALSLHLENETACNVTTKKGLADDLTVQPVSENHVKLVHSKKEPRQKVAAKEGASKLGITEDLALPLVVEDHDQLVHLEKEPTYNVAIKKGVADDHVKLLHSKKEPRLEVAAKEGAPDITETQIIKKLNRELIIEVQRMPIFERGESRESFESKTEWAPEMNAKNMDYIAMFDSLKTKEDDRVTFSSEMSGFIQKKTARRLHSTQSYDEDIENIAPCDGQKTTTNKQEKPSIIPRSSESEPLDENKKKLLKRSKVMRKRRKTKTEIRDTAGNDAKTKSSLDEIIQSVVANTCSALTGEIQLEQDTDVPSKKRRKINVAPICQAKKVQNDFQVVDGSKGDSRDKHVIIPKEITVEEPKETSLLDAGADPALVPSNTFKQYADHSFEINDVIEAPSSILKPWVGASTDNKLLPREKELTARNIVVTVAEVHREDIDDLGHGEAVEERCSPIIVEKDKSDKLIARKSPDDFDGIFELRSNVQTATGRKSPDLEAFRQGKSPILRKNKSKEPVTKVDDNQQGALACSDDATSITQFEKSAASTERRSPIIVEKDKSDKLIARKSPDDFDGIFELKSHTGRKSPDLEAFTQDRSPTLRKNKSKEPVTKVDGELAKSSFGDTTKRKLYRQGSYSYLENMMEQVNPDLDVTPIPIEKGTKIPKQRKPRTKNRKEEGTPPDKSGKEKSRRSVPPPKETTTTEAKKRRKRKKKEFGLSTTDFKSLDQLFDMSCMDIINQACGYQQSDSYEKYGNLRRHRPLDIVVRSERPPSSPDESPVLANGSNMKGRSPELPKTLRVSQTPPHSSDYSWPELEVVPNVAEPRKKINILQDIMIKPKRLPMEEASSDHPFKIPRLDVKEDIENVPLPILSEHKEHTATDENVSRLPKEKDISEGGDEWPDLQKLLQFIFTLIEPKRDSDSVRKLNMLLSSIERFNKLEKR